MGELDGKVAIVTGAGRLRGIGRATAVALAGMGCDVTVTGTGRDPATFPEDEKHVGWRDIESVAQQVEAQGRRALPLVVDVTDGGQVTEMVDKTLGAWGRVDILINNAAYARGPDRVPITELDEAVFRSVMDVKVVGTFLCTRAAAPAMIRQGTGGRIVNLSSTAGKRGPANAAAYAASNGAVQLLTQSTARELAAYGITVNAVCPGPVDTARMDVLGRAEEWAALERSIPMGRAATDEEVAAYIAILCTDACFHVTGQALNFNGGSVMEH